jgi:enoyl-CoA hydratase/carnithine racemase
MREIAVQHRPGGIAVVTLRRPQKRNAMTSAMWQHLALVFNELGAGNCRLIILTGETHFCAGADISEFPEIRNNEAAAASYEDGVQRCYEAILGVQVPVIAAISGVCVGGGCALSLACDFRLADSTVRIGIPAAKLGVVYSPLETQMLFAQVGLSNAKRILYGGELISAEAALRMNLVDHLCDGGALQGALSFCEQMVENAPLSIAAAKLTLNALATGELRSQIERIEELAARAVASDDYRVGVQAFINKRKPVFSGQ